MEDFNQLALTWDDEPRRMERARAVASEMINGIPKMNQMSGLEYGCGTGLLSFHLKPFLKHITLADSSDGMLEVVKEKVQQYQIRNMDWLKLDLSIDDIPNTQFDLIYTLMVMHHVLDIDKVIQAFHQLLNPGGYLCIADLDEEDGSFHGKDFEGHKGFNQEQLTKKLISLGFSNIRSQICYESIKEVSNGQKKKFPVFLMIGQKEGSKGEIHNG